MIKKVLYPAPPLPLFTDGEKKWADYGNSL